MIKRKSKKHQNKSLFVECEYIGHNNQEEAEDDCVDSNYDDDAEGDDDDDDRLNGVTDDKAEN